MCPTMGVQQFANNQVYDPDYADRLPPCYRFCPTDSELIVYLKAMRDTNQHPPCLIHKINIYDKSPDALAQEYQSGGKKWYFLTTREQECPTRNRPKRKAGYGKWRALQKQTKVLDANGVVVGWKRSLAFLDEKGMKTPWLMHEYTSKEPNENDENMFSETALCKIYQKERNQTADDDWYLGLNASDYRLVDHGLSPLHH